MQLDEGESEVASLFYYLGLAAGVARSQLPTLTRRDAWAPSDLSSRFFRALCAGLTAPTAIVLDDYHEVCSGSPVHRVLADGAASLPGGTVLVIASRYEPPPAMTGPRLNGMLEVVQGEDLAFSEAEARAVARLWGYSDQDRELVHDIHARAGGWATGLVLPLAARKRGVGQQARGSMEHLLFEYLAQEMLRPAGPDTRKVLLETALLPHVSAEVAVRLTGVHRAGEILEVLWRRGYFVRRDAGKVSFQYHALFREFLLRRAEAEIPPEHLAKLRLSAGRLLEEAGEEEEAIPLYQEASAWTEMIRVLGSRAPELLREGRSDTVERWVLGIPEIVRACDPWVLFWLGLAQSAPEPAKARCHLHRAFDLFWKAGDARGAYLAWAAAAEACFNALDDTSFLDRWIELLGNLRTRFPDFPGPEVEARVVAAAVGALMNRQPWHPSFREWEERALELALSAQTFGFA